jgi:hypothetical protein
MLCNHNLRFDSSTTANFIWSAGSIPDNTHMINEKFFAVLISMEAARKERSLRVVNFLLILSLIFIAGCAGNKTATVPPADYVEIDNPGYTMSPNAPPTIWVPRSYVESGVPRGSELVKEGYELAKGKIVGSQPQQEKQPAVAASQPVPVCPVKDRIAVLETGTNGLLVPFNDTLKKTSAGILLDPAQTALLARYATVATQAERGAFSVRLQEDYGANLVIFISAPDGIIPGKMLKAEIYDSMGGELVRTVDSRLPQYPENDQAAKDAAVSAALLKLAGQTREVIALIPWYGKVVAVEGDRVYVNAGKEADLRLGQVLKVYRSGKVVKGLGFAPGNKVGTIEVSGFVGTNGAYGLIKEGAGVRVSDLVAFE